MAGPVPIAHAVRKYRLKRDVSAIQGLAMPQLFHTPRFSPLSYTGGTLPGAKMYFWEVASSTPKVIYTTIDADAQLDNPVIADAAGMFPAVWFDGDADVEVTDSDGVEIMPRERIQDGAMDADEIGEAIFPTSTTESAAGVTPVNHLYPPGDVRRYLVAGTDITIAWQRAINWAQTCGGTALVPEGNWTSGTVSIDGRDFRICIRGTITAESYIPENGAVISSFADDGSNQSLLNSIYGPGVQSVRSNVTGSLEGVRIDFEGGKLISSAASIRGIHITGFTRACRITGGRFHGFVGAGILLNGSWSFSIIGNDINGDSSSPGGNAIALGISGAGTNGGGATVVNAAFIAGNECRNHSAGIRYDSGAGTSFTGNTMELNAFGFRSQNAKGFNFCGNYVEANSSANVLLGGTNGTDFVIGSVFAGNLFNASTGLNFNLQGTQDCSFGPNRFSGSQTKLYQINSGVGVHVSGNVVRVPDLTATYFGNPNELNTDTNWVHRTDASQYRIQSPAVSATKELKTATGSLVGFFGADPVAKRTVTGSRGGNAALADLLTELAALGLITDSTSA
jgi:hypothetical protein